MVNFYEIVLDKLRNYCVYQDRSKYEVIVKLEKILNQLSSHSNPEIANSNLSDLEKEEIIEELINEKFLDEKRYVESYVRGKFYGSRWGKNKIKLHLLAKKVDTQLIDAELARLNPDDYKETLLQILNKKKSTSKVENPFQLKAKLVQHAKQKGYETHLIFDLLEKEVM